MGRAAVSGLDPAEHVRLAWHVANTFHGVRDFESLVCEALLALVRGCEAFDSSRGVKPSSFLGPVIKHACISEKRRQKRLAREVALYVVTEEGEERERPDLPVVEPVAEQRVLDREVREAVRHLPDRERHIVERRYGLLDGIPAEGGAVAAEVGVCRQRVSQLEAKAVKALREKLETGGARIGA